MNFIGENEMILNPDTVKGALEDWLNRQRVANLLVIKSWKQRGDGSVSIRFVPEKEMAREMGKRASAACTLKAGPAEVVLNAGSGPARAQQNTGE